MAPPRPPSLRLATPLVQPHAWFVACRSRELRGAPRRALLQGLPLVLFRDADGRASALLDRCPHRNVPLSEGRRLPGGQLECAYHGWRFDAAGACRGIPGREGESDTPARRVSAFATLEQDGFVWAWATPDVAAHGTPFRFPLLDDAGYSHVRRSFEVEASLHALVENALDVPHTAFLHGGLFRQPRRGPPLEVVVRSGEDFVSAEYLGEPRPAGVLGALLAPAGGVVEHTDRFLLPCIAQVEYRLGQSHLVTTTALTPLEELRTAVHTVVSFRLPVPGFVVRPFVTPVAEHVFKQDARMLALQSRTIARFGGEQFASTELDAIGPLALRLLQRAAREAGRDGEATPPIPTTERRFTLRL